MNYLKLRKKTLAVILLLSVVLFTGFRPGGTLWRQIQESLELYEKVFLEIRTNYVDSIDPERLITAGVRGMVSILDPYSQFIDKEHQQDVTTITVGMYSGIGIYLGYRDNRITVTSVLRGQSAQRGGLRPGDVILAVDNHSVSRLKPDAIRKWLRGKPSTIVRLTIARPGVSDTLRFNLEREFIHLPTVGFYGFAAPGIAVIQLKRFTRQASSEFEKALKRLGPETRLRGLILDLRNNPGGLLETAVDIVENFVPKGTPIVSTRGRNGLIIHEYHADRVPSYPSVPLVVLVNNRSASASEIVAGAIQDLDRGVVLGERTFGKGLVQRITRLSESAALKMTTARYYTPSGRCIQEIDYAERRNGHASHSDSAARAAFYTLNQHRVVHAYGGITPDTIVPPERLHPVTEKLLSSGRIFTFSAYYLNTTKPPFVPDGEEIWRRFMEYYRDHQWDSKDSVHAAFTTISTSLEGREIDNDLRGALQILRREIDSRSRLAIVENQREILGRLLVEIHRQYAGSAAGYKYRLYSDPQVQTAISILQSAPVYEAILADSE